MECMECHRLGELVTEAFADGAELAQEAQGGAWADQPEALAKEQRGVDMRLSRVTVQARVHELGCVIALARYAAIPSMTIGTLLSEFRIVMGYVK